MNREGLIAPADYNVVDEIEKFVKKAPERTAVIWEDENGHQSSITYQEIMKSANRAGNAFTDAGLQKGDIVLVMVPRLIEAYAIYIGALKAGLVVIPSSEMLKTKDLEYRISHGDVKAVVTYYPFVDQVDQAKNAGDLIKFSVGAEVPGWHQLEKYKAVVGDTMETVRTASGDMAFLSYTSGTTGNPKGVVHTHGWAFAHLRTAAPSWLAIEEGDIVWATAAPGWQKWIWSPFLSVLGTGATGFVYHGKFSAKKYLSLLEQHKVNVLCCTPTEYRLMAKVDGLETYNLSHLHSTVSAGEPLNREVIDVFQRYFNLQVRDGYGQTENTLLLGITKNMELRPGSMGKPTPGIEVAIVDEEGRPCQAGVVGDIAVHKNTPSLFRTYYKEPERTAKQYKGDFYITGDRAKMDEDGYFWFEGRSDDIIVSSGYTIGPFEVEDALVKHPAVAECAVIGKPDDIRGKIVKAFVILKDSDTDDPSALTKELQNHVKSITAPYKYPREIEYVHELPKTASGKIRRIELRALEESKN